MVNCETEPLTHRLSEIAKQANYDVVIIGSGPAGTAIAEYVCMKHAGLRICILERGPILTTTHVNNVLREKPGLPTFGASKVSRRTQFITAFEKHPWLKDFAKDPEGLPGAMGGMMIYALGGRGIVAGAHLRRFYEEDFDLWSDGRWPFRTSELEKYYELAERVRNVSYGECAGLSQFTALARLASLRAAEPPWGVDVCSGRNADISRGFDSSAARLWDLLVGDHIESTLSRDGGKSCSRRLFLSTETCATKLLPTNPGVTVECKNRYGQSGEIHGKVVVLAASPVESARLVLLSDLGSLQTRPVGRYLAEHMFVRAEAIMKVDWSDPQDRYVNVVVPPPPGHDLAGRYQIHIIGEPDDNNPNQVRLRLTGEAAMDPQKVNCVFLDTRETDEFGMLRASISLQYSSADNLRLHHMKESIGKVVQQLRGRLETESELLGKGRSHHEAGTLRMGLGHRGETVTDEHGEVYGVNDLFVADGSVFPCVGVANPMLTVTAWAYRVADQVIGKLAASF
ncbi:MAG: GMC oxidoreductase [Gammaproteobacteria bacterium]